MKDLVIIVLVDQIMEHFGIFDAIMKRTASSPTSTPNLYNHLIGDKDLRDKFDK